MRNDLLVSLEAELSALRAQGLYKPERVIASPQSAEVRLVDGRTVLNLCANNYLGLADHRALVRAASRALETHGLGVASVRFICGTQDLHKELEARLASFLGTDDAILYSSCFDANGGLFEALLGEDDAVVSDALNHASIIDGIRLCKARRYRYANNDMVELEAQLERARREGAKTVLIATDGVFSMDGVIANLPAICDLADRYGALTMVDDSHAVGVLGAGGRGTHEHRGVLGRIDILTGTLGKALGGATGGYTAGRRPIIEWLRQRSRPYLFSNSLAPMIAAASIACLDLLESAEGGQLRARLRDNSARFREALERAGFTLAGAGHPIVPVMIGDASIASALAERLLEDGVYLIAFSYPVVPHGKARIRTQLSAALTQEHLDRAARALEARARELGLSLGPGGDARS